MSTLQAVVFDWAGTTVDHGSLAPVRAMTELFSRNGVSVSKHDVRRDMGIYKRDHIRRILQLPNVESQWSDVHGAAPSGEDIDRLFAEFIPLQLEVLAPHSQVISGVAETVQRLRNRGLRIAGTTGYTRGMMDILIQSAAKEGYAPEISLCPEDVGGGRPYPWMCQKIAIDLRVRASAAMVKVGDTPSDIEEGLSAGMWTVGVSATGNEAGLSHEELNLLAKHERKLLLEAAADRLELAGAHYVVTSVAEIEPVLERIEAKLATGKRP
ncbi:MAG: phosphonoacetaldehyde hydrolase [Bryobacterales bacterium]|nr:phosphonoacetaldehyde hydrolase [Bryobacterales bacterium]MBV9398416.1 phosphonoacetaldehyde hydrolase [Bryobacterales bacterium]